MMSAIRSSIPIPVPVPDAHPGSASNEGAHLAEEAWTPFVSVVVVARNEQANLGACLECILSQDYTHDHMEVIVVDGMSEDRTRDIVTGFVGRGVPIRILSNPARQRTCGLNIGIQAAHGDVICRVDARTRIPSTYVSLCLRTMQKTGADIVGAAMRPIARTLTQEVIGTAMSHPFGVGNAQFRLGKSSGFVDTVYLGLHRRRVFDCVGLFDEAAPVISEDTELHHRLRQAGGKIYLDVGIPVYYEPRETFADLWKLYFRYGGARAGYVLKHRTFTSWRRLVPPTFILVLASLSAGAVLDRHLLVPLSAVAGVYLAATAGVSAGVAIRRRRLEVLGRLCLAFPCMHLAWALGFWRRLLQRPKPGTYWGY
jgi:succinoglycan biosynthesis protein ExoA